MSTCRSPSASREVLVSRSPGQLSHCEEESHTEKEQSGEHEASHTGDSEICETTLTRRDRYSGPRPPRPQYTEEQEDAIRFHRDDLCMTWTQVMNAYNDLYDHDTGRQWESRSISGLQSRYYRLLDIPVNHAKKQSKPRPELGILVMKPHKRYWWMGQAAEERAKGKVYDPEAELEEEYTASDYDDEQENETTGTQDEVRVMNTNITQKRKRGPGPGPTSAPSCNTAGRSAETKKRRDLRNKIIAQDADEVNANILQETTSIKMEAKDICRGPATAGEALDGEGSPTGVTVESLSTTVSINISRVPSLRAVRTTLAGGGDNKLERCHDNTQQLAVPWRVDKA